MPENIPPAPCMRVRTKAGHVAISVQPDPHGLAELPCMGLGHLHVYLDLVIGNEASSKS